MNIGDLVRMKEDSFKIMGVIVDVVTDDYEDIEIYKVVWIDDLCDPSYATKDNLEEVCKLVT
tara:strand:- start:782 stop:967 length:186 start_codon:yes stop_codon:yes gene_type:complete